MSRTKQQEITIFVDTLPAAHSGADMPYHVFETPPGNPIPSYAPPGTKRYRVTFKLPKQVQDVAGEIIVTTIKEIQ